MTTYVYPSHDDPMGWIRLIWPALTIRSGHVKVMMPYDPNRILYDVDTQGRVYPQIPTDATTMVVQRVTDRVFVEIIRKWKQAGLRVVLDMDDDLRAITSGFNPGAFNLLHGNRNSEVSWHNTEDAAKLADVVTCSTPELVRRYGHGHGMLIRNAIPDNYLRIGYQSPKDDVIGWTGSIGFRMRDPEVLGASLARLQRDGFTIRTIGTDPVSAQEAFRLDVPPQALSSVPMLEFGAHVARFKVGIVPLFPSAFNNSKSWLKGLQYAALGVPFVASAAPDYVTLNRLGAGVLVDHPRKWYSEVKRLMTDEKYASTVSEVGREVATTQTYGTRVDEWKQAWGVS